MSAAAVLAGLLAGLLATACGAARVPRDGSERPLAVATISVVADLVSRVGGDRVEVASIVPIGGDPHVHEPTPSDARLVADADIVFTNGLGLERWLDRLVRAGAQGPVVTVTDGLEPLEGTDPARPDSVDPHLWMDPLLAIGYVEAIRDGLTALDPEGAARYDAGASEAITELTELDRWIRARIGAIPPGRRKLVTSHDAFRYFGERYGLAVVGSIWGISTEREPSADEIARLIEVVTEAGVPAVFVETTINPRLMERVARDAGVAVGEPLYGDSLGPPGSPAGTYPGMMRVNTERIVAGLAGGQAHGGRGGIEP